MNYLYSQESPWNGVEGCSAGFFVPGEPSFLTYNGNIVKLWKYNSGLVLVKEYMLLEKVCQVEKYRISPNEDGLVFLFHKAKVSLARFDPQKNEFKTISLKFFEKDEFDIRDEDIRSIKINGDLGMFQMNKRYFSVFPLFPGMFNAKVFKFADVDGKIKNPIDFTFLENYSIPTVCLVYNSLPRRYTVVKSYNAIVFSIDLSAGKFHVIDEFFVPPKTFKVACVGPVLVFMSHNSILIRSTSSSYSIPLNRMSEACEGRKVVNDIILSDVLFFSRGNTCLIFNGNGDRYRLVISMDIKRIIGAFIEFEGRDSVTSCIGYVNDLLFVGSVGDKTKVFEIKRLQVKPGVDAGSEKVDALKEYLESSENKDQDVQKQDEEYAKLFNEGSESRAEESFVLHQVDEIANIGFLNGAAMKNENEAAFGVEGLEPCICVVSNTMPLEIVKSQKTKRYLHCWKALDFYILGRASETRVFGWPKEGFLEVDGEYSKDVDTLLFAELGNGIIQVTPTYCLLMGQDLRILNKVDFPSRALEGRVVCDGMFLAIKDMEKRLSFYDKEMNRIISISDVTCFGDVRNKIFILSEHILSVFDIHSRMSQFSPCSIEDLPDSIKLSPDTSVAMDLNEKKEEDGIIEMSMSLTGNKILMLLRLKGGYMVAYESLDLSGLFDESFHQTITFFKIRLPRHVAFNLTAEAKAFYNLGSMVFIRAASSMFMVPDDKGHFLYKSRYTLNSATVNKNQLIQLSRGHLMVCKVPSVRDEQYVFGDGLVGRKIPILRIPKHIEYADRYMVVASCKDVEFSSKDEKDCGIPVNTYRFYVDLYSERYEHISTYELDENEYIFDVKYLVLDDMQGNYGKSPFLLVCTTFIEGEDRPARGRLHVLEIISVVPSLESPFRDCKLKVLGIEKTKGSIVQCSEVRGKIALCLGTKIMIYKIDRSTGIIPIGFYDLHIFTSSISVMKNYILASDIYRGLSFFFFQSKPIRLHLISSSEPLKNVTSTELLTAGNELSMVCCDAKGTIHAYTYSPNNIISMDGAKLVKRSEMKTNLGRLSSSGIGFRKNSIMFYSKTNLLIYLVGMDDSYYLKLLKIQTSIMVHLKSVLGLNQRDYLNSDIHLHSLSLKSPIIMHILNLFSYFDLNTQKLISTSVKMSRREILDVLASLNIF
ncbi:pre-mRNA cleavage and polyadenylation [Encephalitozoon romaleae SJ-2008]|uniref:Pre-mRNA cleavage and polyadenylation n=1 Tax=Encephalitozoon romaleae (strain SJ-2008) TaxID=1178016 RepID=I7AQ74_ENCRO|nr:pre-mRNA cleavage and polyadenylation [Encephalitozoon romaleae SJ-2008]AFN84029.1 pre-mRNA cleavage and polyadenylation [Encephalitozoon romaleae SJ-2008]